MLTLKKFVLQKEEVRIRPEDYTIPYGDLLNKQQAENKEKISKRVDKILKKNGIILQKLIGNEFSFHYNRAHEMGLEIKTVKARDLWEKILVSQIETGVPYIGYKDRVNKSSNQKNLGTIQSSN